MSVNVSKKLISFLNNMIDKYNNIYNIILSIVVAILIVLFFYYLFAYQRTVEIDKIY